MSNEPPQHAVPPTVPPPTEAETTTPLPRVPAQAVPPEHATVGLPLLDLLAPQQAMPPQTGPLPPQYPGPYPPGTPMHPGQPTRSAPPMPTVPPAPGRLRRPGARLVIGLAAGVLVLALLGIWALGSSSKPDGASGRSSAPAPTTSSTIRVVDGYQFTRNAGRSDTDCATNSYGKVADFFRATPCSKLDRVLYTSTVDGRPAVVSVSVVTMPTEQAASDLQKLADSNGTGNVADLLRAGVRVPGGPESLTDAGYASTRDGTTVVVVEADFADPAVKDEATLDRISKAALQLGG